MSFLAVLQLVVQLLPLVSQIVQVVETTMPAGTSGAQKLDAVRSILQAGYATEQTVAIEFTKVWPVLQASIAAIVAANNAVGVFTKTPVKAA